MPIFRESVSHQVVPPCRVVLGVPESDAHVVAAKLLEFGLRDRGYDVLNLGACTPCGKFVAAALESEPLAIVACGQNGHALVDLADLFERLTAVGLGHVPIFAGGNLSVGADKNPAGLREAFAAIGIKVLDSFEALYAALFAISVVPVQTAPTGSVVPA